MKEQGLIKFKKDRKSTKNGKKPKSGELGHKLNFSRGSSQKCDIKSKLILSHNKQIDNSIGSNNDTTLD